MGKGYKYWSRVQIIMLTRTNTSPGEKKKKDDEASYIGTEPIGMLLVLVNLQNTVSDDLNKRSCKRTRQSVCPA